jgi:signal transduction histidine kinase
VLILYESRDRSLWIGLDNGGLFRVKDGAVTEHTPRDAPPSTKVPVIFEDEQGLVFWVTGRGLARLRGTRLEPFDAEVGLGYPHGAYRDRHGALWLYGSRGLARLDESGRKVFGPHEGLPHERVRSVCEDRDGGLWAATIGGLAYVKDDVVHKLTLNEGLPESYLRLVLDDGLGHLWIASMGHLFRLDKREVFDVFAGQARQVSPVTFDSADGLRTSETLLSNSPGFRDGQGRLWFATAKGVSVVDPASVSVDQPAPPVMVEGLRVDGRAGRPGDEFPPGKGEVRIEYTALRFAAAGKVRFRYRLEGVDDGWVEAGDRRSASYNNLGPGRYRFAVMASNRDGRWNAPGTSLAFTVRPPFFRTPLFYLGCAAALVGLVAAAYRLHVGQMRSRFAAIIAERTRIARELHDTLAQGLAGVGIQIDTALRAFGHEPNRAREHIKLARAMVRSSLAEVRRSIWVLRAQTSKRKEGLAATLSESLAQLTADTGIEASLQVTGKPRALNSEVERNLLRIAHEAVTNAVRHARARTIATDLRFEPAAVSLLVRDDGQGFDPEACLSKRPSAHFGLVGISERARALGGELRLQSRPGSGTEIVCRLPYDERNGGAEAPGDAHEGEFL